MRRKMKCKGFVTFHIYASLEILRLTWNFTPQGVVQWTFAADLVDFAGDLVDLWGDLKDFASDLADFGDDSVAFEVVPLDLEGGLA